MEGDNSLFGGFAVMPKSESESESKEIFPV